MASSSALTLDDPPPTPPVLDEHLFYPDIDPAADHAGIPPADQRPLLKDRLYVGNLHPSVDEGTLLQVFSKFGKITKLDWLFHKTGVLKGKPRGYAFVEYATADDALNALTSAHGKPLRGRKLVVTFAHQAPLDAHGAGGALRGRRTMMDVGRPTALSMLKTGVGGREGKTTDKIARLEAKLRQMERAAATPTPAPAPAPAPSSTPALSSLSSPAPSTISTPTLPTPVSALPTPPLPGPAHPSLPEKPPPQIAGAPAPTAPPTVPPPVRLAKPAPSSALAKSSSKPGTPALFSGQGFGGGLGSGGHGTRAKARLAGVRIKGRERGKEKEKGDGEKETKDGDVDMQS